MEHIAQAIKNIAWVQMKELRIKNFNHHEDMPRKSFKYLFSE